MGDIRSKILKDAESLKRQIADLQGRYEAMLKTAEHYGSTDSSAPEQKRGSERGKKNEVLNYIQQNGRTGPSQIATTLSIPLGSLYRILKALQEDGKIRKEGKGSYMPILQTEAT